MNIQNFYIVICKSKYHILQTRMNFYASICMYYNTLKISHLYKIGQRQKDMNGF